MAFDAVDENSQATAPPQKKKARKISFLRTSVNSNQASSNTTSPEKPVEANAAVNLEASAVDLPD